MNPHHDPAHAAGQLLSFASPKESNQRKGDPDDWPDPAMLRKKRNGPKLAALKQRAVLIAFFFRFTGPINGDPSNGYLIAIGVFKLVRAADKRCSVRKVEATASAVTLRPITQREIFCYVSKKTKPGRVDMVRISNNLSVLR